MKKLILALIVLMASAAATANAAIDFNVALERDDITPVTGDTDTELDGIAPVGDGSVLYTFDSESGIDSLIKSDNGTVTIFKTEAELSSNTSASESDLCADSSGNVYAMIYDSTADETVVYKIASDGAMTSMTGTGAIPDYYRIAVDETTNSRLYLTISSYYNDDDDDNLAYIDLSASGATPTVLADEAAIEAVLGTTGNVIDITVLDNGDIVYSDGYGSNGHLLLIDDATGAVSTFASNDTLVQAAGGVVGTDDVGSIYLATLSNGRILAMASYNSNLSGTILMGSADGTEWAVVATEEDIAADSDFTGLSNLMYLQGGSFEVDSDDNAYWAIQSGNEFIIKMSGIDVSMDLTPDDPNISVASALSFGSIEPDETSTMDLTVYNTGASADLTIADTSAITGTGFTLNTALPVTIAADGSANLSVTFDPAGVEGLYTGTLTLVSDDSTAEDQSIDVSLAGAAMDTGAVPLMISQVCDGTYTSGTPKVVELVNNSSSAIDLGLFSIGYATNGNGWAGYVALSGTLDAYDTYTVVGSYNSGETVYTSITGSAPDMTSSSINGNGDDTYGLFDSTGTILFDVFGDPDVDANAVDPNADWEYTDATFYRRPDIFSGNTTWTSSEWTKVDLDDYSNDLEALIDAIGSDQSGAAKLDYHYFASPENAVSHWSVFE